LNLHTRLHAHFRIAVPVDIIGRATLRRRPAGGEAVPQLKPVIRITQHVQGRDTADAFFRQVEHGQGVQHQCVGAGAGQVNNFHTVHARIAGARQVERQV